MTEDCPLPVIAPVIGGKVTSERRWTVDLKGEEYDLADLPAMTAGDLIHVERVHEGAYRMVLPPEMGREQGQGVLDVCSAHVARLNGVLKVLDNASRPIDYERTVVGWDASGGTPVRSVWVEGAHLRLKGGLAILLGPDGEAPADSRRERAGPLLAAAAQHVLAEAALTVMGRREVSWPELYVAFEIVQSEVGGKMFERGWIPEKDADLFAWTVNNFGALGTMARHGPKNRKSPTNPMQYAGAVGLVSNLVRSWLRHIAQHGETRQA